VQGSSSGGRRRRASNQGVNKVEGAKIMLPNMVALTGKGVAATNNYHEFTALTGMVVVGVSLCAASFTGTPTGFNVDLNDDGAAQLTALAANTAGTPGEWKSSALGGSADPLAIVRGSNVTVDVNFSGGTSPTADYTLVIWWLPSVE
jgi:hypothetical protein